MAGGSNLGIKHCGYHNFLETGKQPLNNLYLSFLHSLDAPVESFSDSTGVLEEIPRVKLSDAACLLESLSRLLAFKWLPIQARPFRPLANDLWVGREPVCAAKRIGPGHRLQTKIFGDNLRLNFVKLTLSELCLFCIVFYK